MVKELLFQAAKSPLMGGVVGTAFRFCSPVIPVKKVLQNREIIAFNHPKPSYQSHLIITPKRAIKSLRELSEERFFGYFPAILSAAVKINEKNPDFGTILHLLPTADPVRMSDKCISICLQIINRLMIMTADSPARLYIAAKISA